MHLESYFDWESHRRAQREAERSAKLAAMELDVAGIILASVAPSTISPAVETLENIDKPFRLERRPYTLAELEDYNPPLWALRDVFLDGIMSTWG